MENSTFRVPLCHVIYELLVQFVHTSSNLTYRQRQALLLGGL